MKVKTGKKILVVDDSLFFRVKISDALKKTATQYNAKKTEKRLLKR